LVAVINVPTPTNPTPNLELHPKRNSLAKAPQVLVTFLLSGKIHTLSRSEVAVTFSAAIGSNHLSHIVNELVLEAFMMEKKE